MDGKEGKRVRCEKQMDLMRDSSLKQEESWDING
jgi:hypothetical protein